MRSVSEEGQSGHTGMDTCLRPPCVLGFHADYQNEEIGVEKAIAHIHVGNAAAVGEAGRHSPTLVHHVEICSVKTFSFRHSRYLRPRR